MNRVKKSLYTCIGALLLLLGFQTALSLFQVSRLSSATGEVIASSALSGQARLLWTHFVEVEEGLSKVMNFADALGIDDQRKAFLGRAATLSQELQALEAAAAAGLGTDAARVTAKVDAWVKLATQHVSVEGVTELPSYHLLEAARSEVEAEVGSLVRRSAEFVSASVAASQALARNAVLWTVAELILAVTLGLALGWHALRSLHRQLGADASEVARLASAVADGDLTVAIRTQDAPAGSVMAALSRMQAALLDTVVRVRAISDNVANGSGEIAHGNNDLSQRTEQQAAALERTASTMEQLGTTVRHNAENSAQASRLADEASAVALRGGAVVQQAVVTMQGINDSSRRIADIIGVIDGIAFQTNILALNAAVEAARAGEQGRGFAVVASEVRSLAGRSAEAAREIKALIGTSVERVEAGSTLVERAGSTMQEMVLAIGRVTSVMAEIRTASGEQSAGVTQVGQAVAELDQATQQNAALAEQGAAAAEGLRSQGQQLVSAMAFFKLAEPGSSRSAPAPEAPAKAAATGVGAGGSERHGPKRARNVLTQPVNSEAATPAAAGDQPAGAGTDNDDWKSF